MPVTRVRLVFKTHLDIGFTGLAGSVLRRWHEGHFPAALATAAELRRSGGPERFVWTTGSWILHDHLERARGADRRRVERAILAGDLGWHALPFTLHGESCDPSLYEHGLDFAARLDARFGRRTRAAKHSDVPGETLGAVPLLAARGVRLLHIGINPCIASPSTPDLFRWRAPDGSEIVVAYGREHYGGDILSPDGRELLRFVHANDNDPPPDADAVRAAFAATRAEHPGAELVAGDMNAFADRLWAARARLPLVTSEIGNAWVHGVGADPWKLARFQALSGWRAARLRERPALARSRAFHEFSTRLLLVAEHTGGIDNKVRAHRESPPPGAPPFSPHVLHGRWDRAGFLADRRDGLFAEWEASWREQRDYLRDALEALGSGALARSARAAAETAAPRSSSTDTVSSSWQTIRDTAEPLVAGPWTVRVDPRSGALVSLRHASRPRADLAGPRHPLGLFHYQILSASTYDRWWRDYGHAHLRDELWARLDFLKPGLERVRGLRDARWTAPLVRLRRRDEADGIRLLLELRPPAAPVRAYGCPPRVEIEWWLPADETAPVRLVLQWFDKPPCRIPESAWLGFAPRVADPSAWRLRKLSSAIDPRDVVAGGGRRLHGALACEHPECVLRLGPGAALVAPGRADILERWRAPADARDGWQVNLVNNLWGTNFPLWSEGDARFEFTLALPSGPKTPLRKAFPRSVR